jgi:hypothetical protein
MISFYLFIYFFQTNLFFEALFHLGALGDRLTCLVNKLALDMETIQIVWGEDILFDPLLP